MKWVFIIIPNEQSVTLPVISGGGRLLAQAGPLLNAVSPDGIQWRIQDILEDWLHDLGFGGKEKSSRLSLCSDTGNEGRGGAIF